MKNTILQKYYLSYYNTYIDLFNTTNDWMSSFTKIMITKIGWPCTGLPGTAAHTILGNDISPSHDFPVPRGESSGYEKYRNCSKALGTRITLGLVLKYIFLYSYSSLSVIHVINSFYTPLSLSNCWATTIFKTRWGLTWANVMSTMPLLSSGHTSLNAHRAICNNTSRMLLIMYTFGWTRRYMPTWKLKSSCDFQVKALIFTIEVVVTSLFRHFLANTKITVMISLQVREVLTSLAKIQGMEDNSALYRTHTRPVLDSLKGTYEQWTNFSVERPIFDTLLTESGTYRRQKI